MAHSYERGVEGREGWKVKKRLDGDGSGKIFL